MPKRVLVETRDLLFRAKLRGAAESAGAEVVRDAAGCDLVVLDAQSAAAADRIRDLVAQGVRVLAYGSHVDAESLRIAREAGAVAVPNSQVETRLRELLA
jgi:intracellular sulfur oxidation DsrE/DsrF family protein